MSYALAYGEWAEVLDYKDGFVWLQFENGRYWVPTTSIVDWRTEDDDATSVEGGAY